MVQVPVLQLAGALKNVAPVIISVVVLPLARPDESVGVPAVLSQKLLVMVPPVSLKSTKPLPFAPKPVASPVA
ncbi:hypothetical protein GALL_494950 [mine drainage metagenome]|uniref:Uncharacterized protein n=1 Tax=mine drainage metagenome TaxID=410659 RepID=A0A1J5PUE5_9ZZZZ